MTTGTPPDALMAALGVEITEATPERVVATMAVDGSVRQPYGILHGGASVALAETDASVGGALNVQAGRRVGLEINANHLRAKRDGVVTAVGTPLHRGRSTQVWGIELTDEAGRRVCVARCTLAVVAGEQGVRLEVITGSSG